MEVDLVTKDLLKDGLAKATNTVALLLFRNKLKQETSDKKIK